MFVAAFVRPTLSQQLVGLAHAVLDQALTVVQRLDAVGLDGVDLGQEVSQPLRQQSSSRRLQLGKVLPEGLAGLTRAASNLSHQSKRKKVKTGEEATPRENDITECFCHQTSPR